METFHGVVHNNNAKIATNFVSFRIDDNEFVTRNEFTGKMMLQEFRMTIRFVEELSLFSTHLQDCRIICTYLSKRHKSIAEYSASYINRYSLKVGHKLIVAGGLLRNARRFGPQYLQECSCYLHRNWRVFLSRNIAFDDSWINTRDNVYFPSPLLCLCFASRIPTPDIYPNRWIRRIVSQLLTDINPFLLLASYLIVSKFPFLGNGRR